MKNPYKTIRSKVTYVNPHWHVYDHDIIRPDGNKGHYYVVEKDDVAVAIPLSADKKYTYLVRQWRYPVKQLSWEFPMGGIEKNEKPLHSAKRELTEESGIAAKRWRQIGGKVYISNGFSNEAGYIFVAQDLTVMPVTHRESGESDMIVKKFSLKKVYEMANKGEISDGLTVISLFYLKNYLTHIA